MFDNHFNIAQYQKLISYIVPLGGLIMDYVRTHKEQEAALRRLAEAKGALDDHASQLELQREMLRREVSERESAEEALRVLDRAIASSSCGIVISDPNVPDNPVIYVNPAFERITGYSAGETIGRNCRFLRRGDKQQPGMDILRQAVVDKSDCRVTIRNYRKDGSMFWNDLGLSPVPDEQGNTIHFLGIMTDITERMTAEQELRAFAAKLEQSNRELQDFVHVASHDLQEPLRKVLVFSDRLRQKEGDNLEDASKSFLDRMTHSVVRMEHLIKDLLAYSRVTRRAQNFRAVDLAKIAEEVLVDLEVRIEETEARVELGELPTIDADPTQMRQLLQNLISNAIKFKKPGELPHVKVTAEILAEPAGICQIYVQDNGIGFDEKYMERIFTVFQRLHTKEYEGTGVGLTICRKIAERHGGEITAESKPGEGAVFIVALPATQAQE